MPSTFEVSTKTQEASTTNPTVVESSVKVGKESSACEQGALQNGDNSSLKNQQQKRPQQPMTLHGSPRRNFVNRSSSVPQNGYRPNRNNSGNKRPTHDTNNNINSAPKHFGYKGSAPIQQNQQTITPNQAPNEYSHHQKHSVTGHVDSKKPSNQYRSITKTNKMTSYHYDDAALQPPANEAESNGSSQSKHHRYTRYYLEQVGDRMTEGARLSQPSKQKHIPDEKVLAIKAAFGDNSGYYGQFYSGALYNNQQAMLQQQFHHQLFARFQQSQHQHQHQQQQQQAERQYRMYSQGKIATANFKVDNNKLNILFTGQQENYQKFYQHSHVYESESSPSLISYANQQQRNYQQGYSSSPSYQNRNKNERREYRDNPKKKGYGYHNGNSVNNERNGEREYKQDNHPQRNVQFGKSRSFNEQDNKRKDIQRDRPTVDEHAWRSLSPTPPGSSKSSSPGAIDKCTDKDIHDTQSHLSHHELGDDSASTASASSSSSFASRGMKESISTPILLAPEGPTQSVNLWINNNFGGALHNGHSVSAEQLNRETKLIIKRPPSSSGSSSRKSLIHMPKAHSVPSYDPQNPFEHYLSRSAESEMRTIPAELKCGTAWDQVSLAMWEKFQQFQQSHATYHKKMLMWRDLHNAMKVSY